MGKIPGPPPNAVRRRRNKDDKPVSRGERRGVSGFPAADPLWRKDVREFYDAHFVSGQVDFYESSDVYALRMQCELLNRVLRASRLVQVFETDSSGEVVLDANGDKVPVLDSFGEPEYRLVGSVNGQALKSVLDLSQDLLATEGARRKLRIDLGMPNTGEIDPSVQLVESQRARLSMVKKTG